MRLHTNPESAHAAVIVFVFFAEPAMIKPMKTMTLPTIMNQRLPKRSEYEPKIIDDIAVHIV